MKFSQAQWQGSRSRQEDACTVCSGDGETLLLVCDGMGGHAAGDVAAYTAMEVFRKAYVRGKRSPVSDRLKHALEEANEAVGRMLRKRKEFGGTTLAAACMGGGLLWWLSVGDSPLFLWRRRRLIRLNADHSMRAQADEEYRRGDLSYLEYLQERSYLTSALTGETIEKVDLSPIPYFLLPGDRVILGTDGLEPCLNAASQPLDDVARILDSGAGDAASSLIAYLRMMGHPVYDNISVIIADPF
ncbi:MAG: protein phosphatase 2C domain-containing protein [Akkermansiaceae bacterium]|nr:protein phosphatase 2C domain-containing protein [Akkermansia sp.]MCD7798795.1 protein phosphatase 2C domain-containing protein [Akkermansiaceae bacterium]MCD8071079.1 protein phosphatase 2C domain-containing protein [Akkermansiaceae bacterium]